MYIIYVAKEQKQPLLQPANLVDILAKFPE
jgi:hypothetical protein